MLINLLSGSGRLSVGPVAPGIFDNLSTTVVSTTEPGFVVVYVDNQTIGKDVWFDNVQVLHYNTQVLEENHYYPFGLTLSTTAMGVIPQPLKYQAKELEKSFGLEMFDFHARQYDPQLGRFNSIDPLADKFVQISPYGSMNNSPINYVDPNGKDYRVGYHQDEKGNTTITLSSTIYVLGYDQSNKVKEYNQYLKDNPQLLSNSTKNEDGTTTTVNIEMEYVEATQDDVVRLTNPETRNGDNLMMMQASKARSAASPITREYIDPNTGKIVTEKTTDFKAVMGAKDKHFGSPATAFHENMHLFGLRDWFETAADREAVGPNDAMNNHSSGNGSPIMHQIHWNNWIQGVNQQRKQNGGLKNFNSNKLVE